MNLHDLKQCMRKWVMHRVEMLWQHKGPVSTLLLPLAGITRLLCWRKRIRYAHKPELVQHSRRPVIVVGNIFVGGTGKTPVVIALTKALKARGWSPGIVSRGYGARIGERAITGQGTLDPALVGDEPALIARETGVPIAVHPRRALALSRLERDYSGVDVIISDDGLQHLALGRDLEIAVQDNRGTGNGRLLPAGPLREPAERLFSVDFLITNEPPENIRKNRVAEEAPVTGHSTPDDDDYVFEGGSRRISMFLTPHHVEHLVSGTSLPWTTWLQRYSENECAAAAGIGNPQRFFNMLTAHGLRPAHCLALPDHYDYKHNPFSTLPTQTLLITPKDAIKCASLGDDRIWVVHPEPVFSDSRWLDLMHQMLELIAAEKKKKRSGT